jgi:hypothetical protein
MNLNETINTLMMIVSMRMAQDIKYTKVRKKEKMCLLFDLAIHFSAHGIILRSHTINVHDVGYLDNS